MNKIKLIITSFFLFTTLQAFSQVSGGQIKRSSKTSIPKRPTHHKPSSSANKELKVSEPTGYANGHGYVDLGLPSGTLWATCNVGASTPEEYGDYFSWGETATKQIYSLENYSIGFKKYYRTSGKMELDEEDDVAYVLWGSLWRMPSTSQFEELLEFSVVEEGLLNKIKGVKITSKKNGNSIFLPASGSVAKRGISHVDDSGCYYSRSVSIFEEFSWTGANYLFFGGGLGIHTFTGAISGESGHSVRPVSSR